MHLAPARASSPPRPLVLRKVASLLFAALLAATMVASSTTEVAAETPTTTGGDPTTCEGYPEPRVFLESQDWWQPHPAFGGTEDFGHVHAGACFPRTHLPDGSPNKVSGTLKLDVRVMMHDNPGLLRFVRVDLTDRASNQRVVRVPVDETCTVGGEHWDPAHNACVWWIPIEIDTTAANYDGFQEVRLAASVRQQDTDDSMFNTTGWQVYLDNGKAVSHYRANSDGSPREYLEGRGWYEGAGYTNARLESRLPYTVSGTWNPSIRTLPGSGGIGVKWSFAAVNPNFHHGHEGMVLLDQAGPYRGQLSIDTTKLPDGPNRLFIRADAPCDGTSGNDCGTRANGSSLNAATNSGILALTFFVDNGNEVAPPGDDHHHDDGTGGDGTGGDDTGGGEAGGDDTGGGEAGGDDTGGGEAGGDDTGGGEAGGDDTGGGEAGGGDAEEPEEAEEPEDADGGEQEPVRVTVRLNDKLVGRHLERSVSVTAGEGLHDVQVSLERGSHITLEVFDATGTRLVSLREAGELHWSEDLDAGTYTYVVSGDHKTWFDLVGTYPRP
jgi:hypothetical protein